MSHIKRILATLKAEGFKAAFKKHGWKAFALLVGYYLVRDLTLYVFIPAVLATR